MNSIRNQLNNSLISQSFDTESDSDLQLEKCKLIAQTYSTFENCISVLTDMKARKSFLYKSSIAEQFDIPRENAEIKSIWEDELLKRIHPEDLQKKYRLELQFFQLLKDIKISERIDYEVLSKLRMLNKEGRYIFITHRILYINSCKDGSMWLALCLYNLLYLHPGFDIPQGIIVNRSTGKIIDYDKHNYENLLSSREKEILQMIHYGSRSKEIAYKLSLSINTVNRHRQNIFQKLNASNAIEACRIADAAGLL